MKPNLSTRKPIDRITLEDLQVFPIWEFASDEEGKAGRDETWIRPIKEASVPPQAYSQIVSASFSAGPMIDLAGFMIVTTADHPMEISPGAIVSDRYYFIPSSGARRGERERKAFSKSLGITFPLTFKLRVMISGETDPREGTIG